MPRGRQGVVPHNFGHIYGMVGGVCSDAERYLQEDCYQILPRWQMLQDPKGHAMGGRPDAFQITLDELRKVRVQSASTYLATNAKCTRLFLHAMLQEF